MVYECENCGYSTNRKEHHERHLNRKITCKKKSIVDLDLRNVQKNLRNVQKNLRNVQKNLRNVKETICSKCNKELSTVYRLKEHYEKCLGSHSLQCSICFKEFNTRGAKHYHMNNVDCSKSDIISSKSKIVNDHSTVINGNVNIYNDNSRHIHVNMFGMEDFAYLENDDYILDKLNNFSKYDVYGVSKLIISLLFNPDKPENHTIIKTNERGTGVMIRGNDDEWEYREFDDVKEVMFSIVEVFMEFYQLFKMNRDIKLVEPKEFKRVKRFAKLVRKLGCILDDELEKELGICGDTDSDDSEDDDKNGLELEKLNKKFNNATLKNIYNKTKQLYKYVNGEIVKK
uniref:C2H2-type domain-containing protein n=1 Tax=Pyramimonas orientalis virus TaxID=455367 RepID=A0A7L9AZ20_POV01|nr:hypothetical protein HWQ62_00419 [Pyramimonas orientalis virus]